MSKILQTVGINRGRLNRPLLSLKILKSLCDQCFYITLQVDIQDWMDAPKFQKILTFVNRFPWNSIKKSIIYTCNTPGMSFPLYIANNHNISLAFSLIYFSDMKPVWSGLIIISSIFLILWAWTLFTCIMMLIKKFFSMLYVK